MESVFITLGLFAGTKALLWDQKSRSVLELHNNGNLFIVLLIEYVSSIQSSISVVCPWCNIMYSYSISRANYQQVSRDRLSSPIAAPYKPQARRRFGSGRHLEPSARMRRESGREWRESGSQSGSKAARVSAWARALVSHLAAHAKPTSQRVDHWFNLSAWDTGALRRDMCGCRWLRDVLLANSAVQGRSRAARGGKWRA